MNTQRIHRFCLALMVMAMLVRLAGQVEAFSRRMCCSRAESVRT